MKIVTDDKIPFLKGVFEPHAEVLYLPGGEITSEHLRDADCLLVRTRTRCDRNLLEGTGVKFIGTATIGYDHIDTRWAESNGIAWTNAPGCNSGSVAQYINAALHEIAHRKNFQLKDKTLGIIGVGHVGKKVEGISRELGMKIFLNDPPRERSEGGAGFSDLTTLLGNSDIISIHVPLNREGKDKTINLVDRSFLEALKPGAILINTSRGEVVNETEIISELTGLGESGRLGALILDVWQNEPFINRTLLDLTAIATPHIAGYSVDGKYNATRMIVEAVRKYFNLDMDPFPPLMKDGIAVRNDEPAAAYNINEDDHRLRESPETFEQQRNNYPKRWEFSNNI